MPKRRVDSLLAERGLFDSRSRAAASVMAGQVLVGPQRRRVAKPGELIDSEESLTVEHGLPFVSRGGVKLANALDASGLDVRGRRAIDVGAATGGFTDCLLQRGTREVIAVDVGYGELAWRLREDPRVHVTERTNARGLQPSRLPYRPDLAVVDVSFISLTKLLAPLLGCLLDRYDVLALVKPQFEVGRGRVGKGGVVRSADDRRAALLAVGQAARGLGAEVLGYYPSGLAGPKGNLESFIWLADRRRGAQPGQERDLEQMAREAEP